MSGRFILEVFKARLKAVAAPSFCAVFVLLIVAILARGFVFNNESGLRLRVGVLRPAGGRAA
jgi:hypothetical protein